MRIIQQTSYICQHNIIFVDQDYVSLWQVMVPHPEVFFAVSNDFPCSSYGQAQYGQWGPANQPGHDPNWDQSQREEGNPVNRNQGAHATTQSTNGKDVH